MHGHTALLITTAHITSALCFSPSVFVKPVRVTTTALYITLLLRLVFFLGDDAHDCLHCQFAIKKQTGNEGVLKIVIKQFDHTVNQRHFCTCTTHTHTHTHTHTQHIFIIFS